MPHVDVLPERDFAGKLMLNDLPADQDIFYKIHFAGRARSEPVVGHFHLAGPATRPGRGGASTRITA